MIGFLVTYLLIPFHRLFDLYWKLDIDRLKEILSESTDLFPQGHLKNIDDVIIYIREWHRLLEAAKTADKGILILAA